MHQADGILYIQQVTGSVLVSNVTRQFDYADPEYQLEMEYQKIENGHLGFLKHIQTGNHLSSDIKTITRYFN
jgi:hypothetical protein